MTGVPERRRWRGQGAAQWAFGLGCILFGAAAAVEPGVGAAETENRGALPVSISEKPFVPDSIELVYEAGTEERVFFALTLFTAAGLTDPDTTWSETFSEGEGRETPGRLEVPITDFVGRHFGEGAALWKARNGGDLQSLNESSSLEEKYELVVGDDTEDRAALADLLSTLASEEEGFESRIESRIDTEQWLWFFAVQALIANRDLGVFRKNETEYYLLRSAEDGRFRLLPGDLSGVFVDPVYPVTAVPLEGARHFLTASRYARRYRAILQGLLETTFTPEWAAETWGAFPATENRREGFEGIETFLSTRRAEVHTQLPESITVTVRRPGPQYLIGGGSAWKWYVNAGSPPGVWTKVEYEDTLRTGWIDSELPLGHDRDGLGGRNGDGTWIVSEPDGGASSRTLYLRRRFEWDGDEPLEGLRLILRAGGPWIASVNGEEAARDWGRKDDEATGYPGEELSAFDERAAAVDLRQAIPLIRKGENVLALEVQSPFVSGDDWVVDAQLVYGAGDTGLIVSKEPCIRFQGEAPVPPVAEVEIAGVRFPVDSWSARWEGEAHLEPGWNRVGIAGLNENGEVELRITAEWYFAESFKAAPERIDGEAVWSANESPYRIAGDLEIAKGAILRMAPGVVVTIDPWVEVTCRGRLVAEGTEEEPVVITPTDRRARTEWIRAEGEYGRMRFENVRFGEDLRERVMGPEGTVEFIK